ncbi:MAG: Integrase/recombinase XerD [Actinomycetia bacterium]|nr:Integrase/recombinase XerD [Actinomycetes bacterium]
MGEVARLDRGGSPPLPAAVAAYLATLSGTEQHQTRRAYRSTLRALIAEFAPADPATGKPVPFAVEAFDAEENVDHLTDWFGQQWNDRAAATFNRHLDTIRSAVAYWQDQPGWLSADPTRRLRRRGRSPDRTRALSVAEIEALFELDAPIREKTLWRLLYESAARSSEVLALDVQDLDLRNRKAKVTRKGSAVDIIVWQTGTARLLPKLINGRKKGPVFLTDRKARVALAADLDPATGKARLSYRRAEEIFTELTRPLAHPDITAPAELAAAQSWTLHQLRHSALTHAAESGANTSTLLSYSGHTSVTSLARYARVSPEALARWQAKRDPDRRR